MVAHDFTDVWDSHKRLPRVVLSMKCVARTHFAWTTCCSNQQIQMKPLFVMAVLIIWSQAKCFPRDGECTMLIHFPGSLRARRFEKSTGVGPIVWNGSRSPEWCGARWRRQDTVQKSFVNNTEVSFCHQFLSCVQSDVDTQQYKSGEISQIFNSRTLLSRVAPFFFARPFSCDSVPNASSTMQASRVFPPRVVTRICFSFHLLSNYATTSCFSA